ncbi:uncharacterized protein VICG_00699 [Vittaforma corneae ATCC 50505]|uniref:Glutathione peroxidase n=1 Tax=Vittaforma corneae (strain ATCC 50505) TaxID=993615 RepID=L2GNV4_VITCO|nr:uncharacterized protein VICG_00699 [Vittaforma corneae ATCC 50505]ELA42299.1 hypothetical protein VICG_00699 [Vittaforma corneae ATCC 50505]
MSTDGEKTAEKLNLQKNTEDKIKVENDEETDKANPNKGLYDIEVTDINKRAFKLAELKGKVIIIVNVASKCGLAEKSYQELASLLAKYHSKGLRILLFPCRQFLNQEYEQMEKVRSFANKFSENFMLMDEIDVKGPSIHPLFKFLTENLKGFLTNNIKWNFTYFLIGRNGELVRRYGPTERLPDADKDLVRCIGDVEDEVEN